MGKAGFRFLHCRAPVLPTDMNQHPEKILGDYATILCLLKRSPARSYTLTRVEGKELSMPKSLVCLDIWTPEGLWLSGEAQGRGVQLKEELFLPPLSSPKVRLGPHSLLLRPKTLPCRLPWEKRHASLFTDTCRLFPGPHKPRAEGGESRGPPQVTGRKSEVHRGSQTRDPWQPPWDPQTPRACPDGLSPPGRVPHPLPSHPCPFTLSPSQAPVHPSLHRVLATCV